MKDHYKEMWKEIGEELGYTCKLFIGSALMLIGIFGIMFLILKGIGAL